MGGQGLKLPGNALQGHHQLSGGVRALVRVFRQHSFQHTAELRLAGNVVVHGWRPRPFRRRLLPGQHLIENGAQGVNIGLETGCLAGPLLRGGISRTPIAGQGFADGQLGQQFADAEIRKEGAALVVQQDVGGLYIAVDNALRMGVGQGLRQFPHYPVGVEVIR